MAFPPYAPWRRLSLRGVFHSDEANNGEIPSRGLGAVLAAGEM